MRGVLAAGPAQPGQAALRDGRRRPRQGVVRRAAIHGRGRPPRAAMPLRLARRRRRLCCPAAQPAARVAGWRLWASAAPRGGGRFLFSQVRSCPLCPFRRARACFWCRLRRAALRWRRPLSAMSAFAPPSVPAAPGPRRACSSWRSRPAPSVRGPRASRASCGPVVVRFRRPLRLPRPPLGEPPSVLGGRRPRSAVANLTPQIKKLK